MQKYRMSGKINVGCLIIVLLFMAGGYVGYKFGRVYLAQYLLNRKIFAIAGDVAQDPVAKIFPGDRAIADTIIEEAQKFGADIPLENIRIERDKQQVTITATWEGDIVIPNYTHHFVFEFKAKRRVVY